MLHRLVHDRGLIAAVVALASLASPWASAARADTPQVTVVRPGGAERTLALEALAGSEDVVDRGYSVRSGDGSTTRTVPGFSLGALIEASGADPYGFSYLEVQRPGGGSVLLSRDQALSASGEGPPVVYATATGTAFLRPSTGAEDLNAGDSFEAPQGIALVLRQGAPLRVRAEASTVRTRPGRPVAFEAIVERAGAGERLHYSWYFDDGHSARGSRVRHSFAQRGSYDVVVGVTTGANEAGSSAVVTIQVGAPPAGPDRKGGGRNESKGAPDHGAAAGPSSGGGGGETGTSYGASPTPASGAPSESAQPSPVRPPRGDRRKDRPTDPPPGERIEGELLSIAVAPTPAAAERAKQAAARRGRPSDEGGGLTVPAAALGALATVGLLAGGAALEGGAAAALRRRVSEGRPA